jgi:hypothetical protein
MPALTEDGFDPHHRELCPDGGCIGLIGPDGRCKVCGIVSPNAVADPRHQGLRPEKPAADPGEASDPMWGDSEGDDGNGGRDDMEEDSAGERTGSARGNGVTSPDHFENRQLCPDGACIGLIGADGRCKECGRPQEASAGRSSADES